MQTEKEKMLDSKLYDASNQQLINERIKARELLFEFNNSEPTKQAERTNILQKLLGKTGNNVYIEPPFHCDYGYNIEIGKNFYANFNLVILDPGKVIIGDNVLIGPNVGIFTAGHPIHHEIRNLGPEFGLPITIGNNVWIGGNVLINPGISIGDNSVIGSGSVVTKNIPSNVVAAGNPCKVLREITDADKEQYSI